MSDETTKGLPRDASLEEKVLARLDALEAKLDQRSFETKPIWERALAEILEVKQSIDATNQRLDETNRGLAETNQRLTDGLAEVNESLRDLKRENRCTEPAHHSGPCRSRTPRKAYGQVGVSTDTIDS